MIDLYAELGLPAGADGAAIKKSYRQLVLKYHPDKNPEDREGAEERIRKINNAYETLGNTAKKAAYDGQARSVFQKAQGMRVNTTMIQPRMAIPKAFMLVPIGHPDKFMRVVQKGLAFQSRAEMDDLEFDMFFMAARFSLWWLPEVNNMCRLRTQPVINTGVVGINQVMNMAGAAPSGAVLSFGLSPVDSTSDVMLTNSEFPATTNVIAVASPDYPGAFRFEAAYFPAHFLTFDPPTHTQMMKSAGQFSAVDFILMDFAVAEHYKTLDEILIPAVVEIGGDRDFVKLIHVCRNTRVQFYFKATMGGAIWDFNDFALYFHAHSDSWDYDPDKQLLRLRGLEDKLGRALKRARTPAEATSALRPKNLLKAKQEVGWLPLDCIEVGLRLLSDVGSAEQGVDVQTKLLSILKNMCLAGQKTTLTGLTLLWEALVGFGGSSPHSDIQQLRADVVEAVALCATKLVSEDENATFDAKLLGVLLVMPLNWEKCADILSQKGQQSIAKEPLEKLVPLIRKAGEAKAGKFGECLSTSAMMKSFGAEPGVAVDALDAMVSGGFGLEGVPMMLRMLLPRVPPESGARVVAGLAEHGASGSDFDACLEVALAESTFEALPLALRERLEAHRKVRERSRSRSRQSKK